MNRLIIEKEEYRGVWGALTEICKVYNLPYHSIKDKPFPIEVDGYVIRKVKYRVK
jgi:hypothetical protein